MTHYLAIVSDWGVVHTLLGDTLGDRVSARARISLQTSCGPGWLAQDGRCLVTKEGWAVIRTSGVGVTRGALTWLTSSLEAG